MTDMNYPVYLDHNATTPCDPQVVDAMLPYLTNHFGNASSKSHAYGWVAEEAVDIAREQVAALIGAEKQEIVFTSGATEAVNLALQGIHALHQSRGRHIITCGVEHKAVIDTCAHLSTIGAEVTMLPVDQDGQISLNDLEQAIRKDTILIALMYANNETGVMMPVREISAIARKHGVLFFCDATQAVGKVPVDVAKDGIDVMSLSAHKLYGPKGVGALYVRRKDPRVRLQPLIYGGGHERGMRSGTLNVPGIVGFGRACAVAANRLEADAQRIASLRNRLLDGLLRIEGCVLNGNRDLLLPNTCNVSFRGMASQVLIAKLNKKIAVSSGSACTSATLEPSYVLMAMGLGEERASQSLRFSLGRATTEEEITQSLKAIHDLF